MKNKPPRFLVRHHGVTVELAICWPQERAQLLRERWPQGVIDLDAEAPPNSPAAPAERYQLELMHARVARKQARGAQIPRAAVPQLYAPGEQRLKLRPRRRR